METDNFWCITPLDLQEVAARIGLELATTEAEFDAENLYEWFEARTPDGTLLNVSRKHDDGQPITSDPLRIMTKVTDEQAPILGRKLAVALSCRVFQGDVAYLGGDDFVYTPARHFDP